MNLFRVDQVCNTKIQISVLVNVVIVTEILSFYDIGGATKLKVN